MHNIKKIDNGLYRKLIFLNRACQMRKLLQSALRRNRPYHFNALSCFLDEMVHVSDYLGITLKEFCNLYRKWDAYVAEFAKFVNHQDFYLSWTGDAGRSNLCANVVNQVIPYTSIYAYLIGEYGKRRIDYCDYGCGTGTFSFVINRDVSFNCFHLYDVPNTAADYIDFRITTGGLEKFKWFNVLDQSQADSQYDLIVCLDVLEHLANSSKVFLKISGMLKTGGVILLRAPWGNHPEHIPEAAVNFYREDGYAHLRRRYKLLHHFGCFHLHGAYRKI